ncbi:hypothetical protein GGS20DRAFT_577313 [Poronia punctata]|nr:hypothetical protein GGS20DRAFT_577313 [Poronia punctata]
MTSQYPAIPAAKPKRRLVPQLIEETTRSNFAEKQQQKEPLHTNDTTSTAFHGVADGKNVQWGPIPSIIVPKTAPTVGDCSVQSSEPINSNGSRPFTKPIRRFAPIPIETTFDSYRVANKNCRPPLPEPTPEPSPTVPQSSSVTLSSTAKSIGPHATQNTQKTDDEKKPTRRFAPQLIETTRRVRRAGQDGPATKHIDKTDITPGTNHIYAPKPKRKQGTPWPTGTSTSNNNNNNNNNSNGNNLAHAAPGGDGDAVARFLGPRRQRSIKAHPNTRRATRTNSYQPELDTILSSESGNSSEDEGVAATALNLGAPDLSDTHSDGNGDPWSSGSNRDLRDRRESCDEEFSGYLLGIAAREAHRQRQLEQALSAFPNGMPPQGVEHFLARDNSEDDIQVGDDEPPLRHGPSQLLRRKSTDPGWAVKEMRAHAERLAKMRAETCLSIDDNSDQYEITTPPEDPLWTTMARHESRDLSMGSPSSPFLYAQTPALCTKLPLLHEKPYTPPPSTGISASPFGVPFAAFQADEPEDAELLKMRQAASPPMLGTDLVFRMCPSPRHTRMEPNHPYAQFDRREERNRDPSGVSGLWHGYCSSHAQRLDTPGLQPPHLLHTPGVCPPTDPFSSAFATSVNGNGSETHNPAPTGDDEPTGSDPSQIIPDLDHSPGRGVQQEDWEEREQAILTEFDDAFVTQVFNYLSLGYPATARAFDHELSKISGVDVEELRREDTLKIGKGFMREMEISPRTGSIDSGTADMSGDEHAATSLPYERGPRCKPPRWEALKLYIHEWARQHPALNCDDDSGPPAWGVRARRGSWAI